MKRNFRYYIFEVVLVLVAVYLAYIVFNGLWVNLKLRGYEEKLKVECSILENKIKILEDEIKELKESSYRIEEEARLFGMVKENEEIIKFIR